MPELPGWVIPVAIFLATELGAAIWLAADLRAAVKHLREELQELKESNGPARLAKLEARVDEHQRRLDEVAG